MADPWGPAQPTPTSGGNPWGPVSAPVPQSNDLWHEVLGYAGGNNDTVNKLGNAAGAVYKQAVASGPIMNGLPGVADVISAVPGLHDVGQSQVAQGIQKVLPPLMGGRTPGVRDIMEQSGFGRQPGETDAQLHQRYNQGLTDINQQTTAEATANQIGNANGSLGDKAARVGQQVLNIGAGVAANPQYLLAPQMGLGAGMAGRLGGAMAGNAIIGAAGDAAAQMMDMAQGQKKDFDIEQNLKSAMIGGAVGGAIHGAVEVSPFVKGLFGNRGIDTTPQADPRPSQITPMTQDHVQLNAQDHAQYQQLLQTGSVDDIKNFFQGRQGPQPNWQDVNTWVEHRDGQSRTGPVQQTLQPDFNYQDQYNQHAEMVQNEQHRQNVEDHVNNQTAGWTNAPNVEVVHGPADIADPGVRAQALKEDRPGSSSEGAPGFYGKDGTVRIYSGRNATPEDVNALLYHEGLGHFGLAQQFGDKLDSTLTSLLDRNVNQLSRDTDAWQKANPKAYGGNRLRAAEEVLAERSESGAMPKNWKDAMESAVRQFGRKMGLNLSYNDAEVSHILAMSHDAVINGKSGARENGFNSAGNRFMFIGKNSRGFDPYDAGTFRASDGQQRSEISDKDAKLIPHLQGPTLADHLDHPELFDRYPELRDIPVSYKPPAGSDGAYWAKEQGGPHIAIRPDSPDVLRSVLHETQHAIQDIEGYPDFRKLVNNGETTSKNSEFGYRDHPSEQEAFTTEDRAGMSMRERDANPIKFMRSRDEDGKPPYLGFNRRTGDTDSPAYQDTLKDFINSVENFTSKHTEEISRFQQSAERYKKDWEEGRKGSFDGPPSESQEIATSRRLALFNMLDKELSGFHEADIHNLKSSLESPYSHESYMDALYAKANESLSKDQNKFMTRAQQLRNQIARTGYIPEDLQGIHDEVEKYNEGKEPISWEETRARAFELGLNPNKIPQVKQGELTARIMRAGASADLAAAKADDILSRLGTDQWKETDQTDLAKAIADRNWAMHTFLGHTSEAGRALNVSKVFRQYSAGHIGPLLDALRENESGLALLADPTNPQAMLFMQQLKADLKDGANPKAANVRMDAVNKPYWWQYLTTFHMNMMLSALSTHVKAPIDMTTGILRNVIEKSVAIPISKTKQLLGGGPGVEFGELASHIFGLGGAVADGEVYRAVARAAKTGDSSYVRPINNTTLNERINQLSGQNDPVLQDQAKLDTGRITQTNFANQFGAISSPRFTGAASIINKPTDLISAQDTFFRSVEMNGQLRSIAYREATEQLGPKASIFDKMSLGKSLALNPTESMIKEAYLQTNKTLLLNDNPLNTAINKLRVVKPGMNGFQQFISFVVSNLAPFIRVESNNLLNRVIDRSPLGLYQLFDPRSDIRQGGAKADIAWARIAYGSALLGLYWNMADPARKLQTGSGPDNVDKYKEKIAGGWRPNAVSENGGYNTGGQLGMSVNPFDVHNKTAQLVASARQAYDAGMSTQGWGSALMIAAGSVGSNLANMSWLSDVHPAIEAATAHGQTARQAVTSFASNTANTWLPAGMNQAARLNDPDQRDTNATGTTAQRFGGAIANSLQSEIPGLRKDLPIKYNVYGSPLANGASLTGVHTIIPGLSGNGTTETNDPGERELDRLQAMSPNKALMTPVQHSISKDPQDSSAGKIQLTTAQFEEYQHLAGSNTVNYVKQMMNDGSWSKMTDEQRAEEVYGKNGIEQDMKKAAAEVIRSGIK